MFWWVLIPIWSGWQDSNLRPPAPKAGAITGLRYTPSDLLIATGRDNRAEFILIPLEREKGYTPNNSFRINRFAESMRFELMRQLLVDSLANCSINHSGNSPLNYKNLSQLFCGCKSNFYLLTIQTFFPFF